MQKVSSRLRSLRRAKSEHHLQGRRGSVKALDALTGGPITASPVSYLSAGTQYMAIAAGRGLFVFSLD